MEKIWLANYPRGVPEHVEVTAYPSLCDVLERSVATYGARAAYTNMGASIDYLSLERLSRDFAAFLQSELRLQPGTRVALMMPNILQYPLALFGILRAGCTAVNCNPLYTPRELKYQLQDSGAEAIVVLENFASALQQAVASTKVRHVIVTSLGEMLGFPSGLIVNSVVRYVRRMVPAWDIPGAIAFAHALRLGRRAPFERVRLGPQDLAFLQYTGGTTGIPKGAMLTHGNVVANLQQVHAWLRPVLTDGAEVAIAPLPLYHIFALTACLVLMKIGATTVLVTNPRDIPGFVKELARRRFSVIIGVNTLFNALLNDPHFARLDFTTLRVALGGGMAVQRAVAERWKKVTGKALIEAYGMTETSPAVTINPLDLPEFNGAIGLPIPSTEIAIRDDIGSDVPAGEVGELCVRGPQVTQGYWGRPAETRNVLMPDGFLRTGDLATIDAQGYVRIVDRKKDMIIVSGFKVFPNEVEDVVATCPGVLEVAAFGVPDATSGQAVRLAIVKKDPQLTAEDVIAFCRKNLTGYKIPRRVEFRDELPKTPIGKILRRALVEQETAQA